MPGNYGPPSMRLEEKQRTDSEIVWADRPGVRIAGTFGFVIATAVSAVFVSQGYGLIVPLITEEAARENLTNWNGGLLLFDLVESVFAVVGAVFGVWMWLYFAPLLLRCYSREEWHFSPTEQRAEFRRKPVFRKWTCEIFEAGMVTAVHLENEPGQPRDEPLWSLWVESGGAGKRFVDCSVREAELRRLATDFATTFALSFST